MSCRSRMPSKDEFSPIQLLHIHSLCLQAGHPHQGAPPAAAGVQGGAGTSGGNSSSEASKISTEKVLPTCCGSMRTIEFAESVHLDHASHGTERALEGCIQMYVCLRSYEFLNILSFEADHSLRHFLYTYYVSRTTSCICFGTKDALMCEVLLCAWLDTARRCKTRTCTKEHITSHRRANCCASCDRQRVRGSRLSAMVCRSRMPLKLLRYPLLYCSRAHIITGGSTF